MPIYDGNKYIGSATLTTNLDMWDGLRWRYEAVGCHLGIGKLDDGRYYACYASDWPEGIVRRKQDDGTWEILFRCEDDFGPPALAAVITEEEAKELVRKHNATLYEEMFGGSYNGGIGRCIWEMSVKMKRTWFSLRGVQVQEQVLEVVSWGFSKRKGSPRRNK